MNPGGQDTSEAFGKTTRSRLVCCNWYTLLHQVMVVTMQLSQKFTAKKLSGVVLAIGVTTSCFSQPAADVSGPTLPGLVVTAPRLNSTGDEAVSNAPAAIGKVFEIDLEYAGGASARLEDTLVESGLAYWDASGSLGISSGLGFRGFALSNQGNQQLQGSGGFVNGHRDIAWRFARDPATIARVQVVQGNDATLLGAGSPGGLVQYITKTPTGTEGLRLQSSVNSSGGLRFALDGEKHLGILQVRAVFAAQRGERTLEGVKNERTAALVSTKLPWASGEARFDLEYHGNAMPFPFGTAYAGGKFWLDQPYVDERSSAERHYRRQALYLRQDITDSTTLNAHWQKVSSSRDETLLGFFDPLNKTTLRGYYRLIKEANQQADVGLKLNGKHDLSAMLNTSAPGPGVVGAPQPGLTHRWTLAYASNSQGREFAGPQNIGGFSLNLVNPQFPENLNLLRLSPRFVYETFRERGLGAASVLQLSSAELRLGFRRSAVEIDSVASATLPQKRVADSEQNTASAAVGWTLSPNHRVWVSYAQSFQPNRGTFSGGAYLPPSLGRQKELGWERTWAGDAQNGNFSVQAFDILQSNLPRRDPKDPDAFLLTGAVRASGISAALNIQSGALDFKSALTQQHVRVQNLAAGAQGTELVGVPARFGSASAAAKSASGLWTIHAQGASSLAGDAVGSFRASGYVVYGLRWQAPARANTPNALQWGMRADNLLDRRYVRALTGADNVWQGERRKLAVWAELAL